MFNKLRKKHEKRLIMFGKLDIVAKICSFLSSAAVFAGICFGVIKIVSSAVNGLKWQKEKRRIMESLKGYDRSEYYEPLSTTDSYRVE